MMKKKYLLPLSLLLGLTSCSELPAKVYFVKDVFNNGFYDISLDHLERFESATGIYNDKEVETGGFKFYFTIDNVIEKEVFRKVSIGINADQLLFNYDDEMTYKANNDKDVDNNFFENPVVVFRNIPVDDLSFTVKFAGSNFTIRKDFDY